MKKIDTEKFLEDFQTLVCAYYQGKPLNLKPKDAKIRAKAFIDDFKNNQMYASVVAYARRGIKVVIKNKEKRTDFTSHLNRHMFKRSSDRINKGGVDPRQTFELLVSLEPYNWIRRT